MKYIYLIFCMIVVLSSGCKKNETRSGELYDTWRLTESYSDIGNGKGKYQRVTGEPKYLTFNRSGKLSGNAFEGVFSFKVIDSNKMEVYSETYKQSAVYSYTLSGNSLTLNPPCIEGCGLRFVRK